MTPDVSELVERLEGASAGGRELSGEVLLALGFKDISDFRDARDTWSRTGRLDDAFHQGAVTTSLDAALALAKRVLPDHDVQIMKGAKEGALAAVSHYLSVGVDEATARTMPLALVSATLKALAVVGFSPSAQDEPIPTEPVSPPVVAPEESA